MLVFDSLNFNCISLRFASKYFVIPTVFAMQTWARPVSIIKGGLASCLMSGLHWKADFSKAATHLELTGKREPSQPADGTSGELNKKHFR